MSWFKDNLWPAWFWNRWYAKLNDAYENGYQDGMGQKGHNDLVVSVRKQTEERIIKLLEPLTICDEGCDHYDCGTWEYTRAIALIKGEK